MGERTIAIGDIHGCSVALATLIESIELREDDRLIFLGDYIDRGSDSRGVIGQVLQLKRRCQVVTLMGNHELMLLGALESRPEREFWLQYGGSQTVDSYGGRIDAIPRRHLQFIERCVPHYETDEHFFVHANYAADLPLDQQPDNLRYWTHLTRALPPPHQSGKTAVVGHTPQITGDVMDLGHLVCIDTFCFGGHWLTALDVNAGQLWQASESGQLR